MMITKVFYINTVYSRLPVTQYLPEKTVPRAALLFLHGIMETSDHYQELFQFLVSQGISVMTYSHYGHGKEAEKSQLLGHSPDNGFLGWVEDAKRVFSRLCTDFSDIPQFIMGHSMGALVAQELVSFYPEGPEHRLSGVILSAPPNPSILEIRLGSFFSSIGGRLLGAQSAAVFLHWLTFLKADFAFKRPFEWLSRDSEFVSAYKDSPYCGFTCSYGMLSALFEGLKRFKQKLCFPKLTKSLPYLFLGGKKDPLYGKEGRLFHRLLFSYQSFGFTALTTKLYPELRHSICHDLAPLSDDTPVSFYDDLSSWFHAAFSTVSGD